MYQYVKGLSLVLDQLINFRRDLVKVTCWWCFRSQIGVRYLLLTGLLCPVAGATYYHVRQSALNYFGLILSLATFPTVQYIHVGCNKFEYTPCPVYFSASTN